MFPSARIGQARQSGALPPFGPLRSDSVAPAPARRGRPARRSPPVSDWRFQILLLPSAKKRCLPFLPRANFAGGTRFRYAAEAVPGGGRPPLRPLRPVRGKESDRHRRRRRNNKIVQIDLASGKAVGSVKLPSEIRRLLPTPDGKRDRGLRRRDRPRLRFGERKGSHAVGSRAQGKWTPELTPEDKAFLKNFPPDVQKELNKPLFSPACLDASVSSDGKTLATRHTTGSYYDTRQERDVSDLASGKHHQRVPRKRTLREIVTFNPKKPDILFLLSGVKTTPDPSPSGIRPRRKHDGHRRFPVAGP